MLDLFPVTARVDDGELSLGGVPVSGLAAEHGTPLLVYCEETLRTQARAYRTAAPDALIAYGTKAFANVEVLRVLAGEGIGADVSTLGELAFARRAGIPGDRLLFHGNNKSDEELRAAAEADAAVVIDASDEPERAAAAGVRRVLVRLTPGVEAVTHQAIATAHDGSKFGLAHDDALAAIDVARGLGLQVAGIHFHVGSQLAQIDESLVAVDRLAAFCEQARSELGWTPSVIDLGGGLGVRHNRDEHPPEVDAWVQPLIARLARAVAGAGAGRLRAGPLARQPRRRLALPRRRRQGERRRLVRRHRRRHVGQPAAAAVRRPLRGAAREPRGGARHRRLPRRREALRVRRRADRRGRAAAAGARRPLAVPATGAYTLAISSNYNGVPRPEVVLVHDGEARVIRRARESVADLLQVRDRR